MTINVKHKFRSQKADSTDASAIRPSNWNDAHTITMNGPAILGRATGGEGDAQELSIGTGLEFNGTTLRVVNADAATLGGQAPAYYTNIPARLGFTPVISANPGRIQMHWGANNEPYFIIDTTFIQLAKRSDSDAALNAANAAGANADRAFSSIRLGNSAQTYDTEVGNGCVLTGAVIQQSSLLKVFRQIQGFSASRGWVAATSL